MTNIHNFDVLSVAEGAPSSVAPSSVAPPPSEASDITLDGISEVDEAKRNGKILAKAHGLDITKLGYWAVIKRSAELMGVEENGNEKLVRLSIRCIKKIGSYGNTTPAPRIMAGLVTPGAPAPMPRF